MVNQMRAMALVALGVSHPARRRSRKKGGVRADPRR